MHINKIRKYYFISKFDTNNIDKQDKQTTIIYRNYSTKTENQTLILKIKEYCKKKSINFYLSNNVKLAIKLDLDGAYIPAFNKNLKHLAYTYKKKFKLIGSAHNLKEIRIKEKQKVKIIFISPVFFNQKNKTFLGIYKFMNLKRLTRNQTVCLGGINKNNMKILFKLNIKGIAGISMFS